MRRATGSAATTISISRVQAVLEKQLSTRHRRADGLLKQHRSLPRVTKISLRGALRREQPLEHEQPRQQMDLTQDFAASIQEVAK